MKLLHFFVLILLEHSAHALFGLEVKKADPELAKFKRCLMVSFLRSRKLVERDLNDAEYKQLNTEQWNLRKKTVYPRAYYLPTSTKDVAAAVTCGLKANIRLTPTSGGHSYEGLGFGDGDSVVVDFRNMADMRVEGKGASAIGVLEPGANVGNINAFLWENGGYAIPMGNCLTVGIGGHAIGGGIGYFTSYYGLATDNLVEAELVDAKGNIVTASKTNNPDLFWAMQGSGPGLLGIVTKLKVKLFEASRIKITMMRIHYGLKDFAVGWTAFQDFQKWVIASEPKVMLGMMVVSDTYNATLPPPPPGMLITLVHIEDPSQHPKSNEDFLKAANAHFPAPAVPLFVLKPDYMQFTAMTTYAPYILPHPVTGKPVEVGIINKYLSIPPHIMPAEDVILSFIKKARKGIAAPRYFKAKSFYIKNYASMEQLERVQDVIMRMPQNNFWILVNSEQGVVGEVARNATAYVHRDSLLGMTLQYEGSADPRDVVPGMQYLDDLYAAMKFMDGGETYQNYPDLDETDHFERNYKENLPRLIQLKQKLDPKNYFVSKLSLPIKQEL